MDKTSSGGTVVVVVVAVVVVVVVGGRVVVTGPAPGSTVVRPERHQVLGLLTVPA